jgi:(p)ppGpp synthase/HD superfamily hydrolase
MRTLRLSRPPPLAWLHEHHRPLEQALALAVDLHRHQRRKGGELPYIGHLLGVCSNALEHGADEDEAIAALLHDSIEDQAEGFGGADKLRAHLRSLFGEQVLAIVEGCTDAETVPKPPWRARKEAYVAHLTGAAPSILLVSACDKLHNARAIQQDFQEIGNALWSRFNGGREGTLWYYRALSDAFLAHGSTPLRRELERSVSELETLAADTRGERLWAGMPQPGPSGWARRPGASRSSWRPAGIPSDWPAGQRLAYYAQFFDYVELNSSINARAKLTR